MGTIASVLQWSCTNCNVINPTESLKCLNCGTVRKVCEGTLKHSDSSSLRISKNLNSGGGGGGAKELTTSMAPEDNKSSTNLTNKQQPQQLHQQVTHILTQQTLETERDETLASRYVFDQRNRCAI